MKYCRSLLAGLALFCTCAVHAGIDELLPLPRHISACAGTLLPPPTITYAIQGQPGPRLTNALQRFGATPAAHPPTAGSETLHIALDSTTSPYPDIQTDESYRLSISPTAGIHLRADNGYGAMHGLETLKQLLDGGRALPCVVIEDSPRYRWRGLMLDVVRHWLPADAVRRQLDAMARYKMNVLHWHLSDDQGFRVESPRYPALHETGSDGDYYSQTELRELIEYAADRGIRVVPEFDLPGHSRSWQLAFPQLASVPEKKYYLYHQEGIFSDPIDPTQADNLQLIAGIISEMAGLFPDRYFHMGGDEVNYDAWDDNKHIQQFIDDQALKNNRGLQAWFIARYVKMLRGLGKTPIGWDEVAGADYPPEAVIDKWRSTVIDEAERSHPIIASTGFYLDHMQSAWQYYRNDPGNWDNAQGATILGGEASSWGESTDEGNIDQRVWPRTLAIAELLWSPATATAQESERGLYERIDVHSRRLAQAGLRHRNHLAQWFTQGRDPRQSQPLMVLARAATPQMYGGLMVLIDAWMPWPVGPWQREVVDRPFRLDQFIHHLDPESASAWRFNQRVQEFLASGDSALAARLRAQLEQWRDNHMPLLQLLETSPDLAEQGLAHLSLALHDLALAGLAALEALQQGETLSDRQYQRVVARYAYRDPVFSTAWLTDFVLDTRHLYRPLVHARINLPAQRGIAALVTAAKDPERVALSQHQPTP